MTGYDPREKLRAYGLIQDPLPVGLKPITMAPALNDKMAEKRVETEMVERAYSCARDHVTDKTAVMELADDIQYLMLWAWRKGRQP